MTKAIELSQLGNVLTVAEGAGNVGIRESSPSYEFHVKGAGTVAYFEGTGGNSFIGLEDSDDSSIGFIGVDGGSLKFQTSGSGFSDKFTISSGGTKQILNGNLNIYQTYIDFSGDQSSTPQTAVALYRPADGTFAISTQNDERLRITSDGKVGIGTDNPEEILHILGPTETISSRDGVTLQHSTATVAADNGLPLVWSGYVGSGSGLQNYGLASICGRKENSNTDDGAAYLQFGTGNAAGAITERLRIASDGQIGMGKAGTVTPNGNSPLTIQESDSNSETICLRATNSGGNGSQPGIVMKTAAGGHIGGIYCDVNSDYMRLSTSGDDRVIITNDGKVRVPDNGKFTAGAGDDLQIYHDGAHNRIKSTTGGLYLHVANGEFLSQNGSEVIAKFLQNAAVELYYDNSKKLETTGSGVSIQGSIVADSALLQNSSTSSWFQTGTSIASYNYVWAAKDSLANVWHSGLQTDGDLYLGGNLAGSNNIGLSGSNGSAFFASQALNIGTTGNITIVNPTTSAKIKMEGDINGNYTGWKEKNVASGSMSAASIASKTPTINDFTYPNNSNGMLIWSTSKIGFAAGAESPQYGSGVQMLFDGGGLILGGNRAFDRTTVSSTATNWTVRLRTSGIGQFKGALYANPFQLTSADSYIRSGYGAISNSTVSSLNNLLIAQNLRGYIQGIDGGSANNNFYSVVTHGGMGYAGTEYYYGGITKFFNGTGGTTANNTISPNVSMQISGSGYVGINAVASDRLHVKGAILQEGISCRNSVFAATFGAGTHNLFTLTSNGVDNVAIATLEYVALYSYASNNMAAGVKFASTRRSSNNTSWTTTNGDSGGPSGNDTGRAPTLYFDAGVLKLLVGGSVQVTGTIRITVRGFTLTRNYNAG